jgi:hypothetical protein
MTYPIEVKTMFFDSLHSENIRLSKHFRSMGVGYRLRYHKDLTTDTILSGNLPSLYVIQPKKGIRRLKPMWTVEL